MKKGIFKVLSISLILLMLTTTLSFAAGETASEPEVFKPVETGIDSLTDEQKSAIEKDINSSAKMRALKAKSLKSASSGSTSYCADIYYPEEDSCYCLADSMEVDVDVMDTYSDAYTCPMLLIFNSNDKLVESFKGNIPVEVDDWTNYSDFIKLNLSKYTSGTHYLWVVNFPCDEYANIDDYYYDNWYDECEWTWVRFYIGPYGKVTILNTIANSAKKTNDVIWDKSKIKGEDSYEINWRARGASTWATRTVGKTTRGTTSGLTIGQLYEIRVRPKLGGIGGKWSDTVYRYFHTTQKIRLTSKSKGSFTMSWARNSKATSYQVMFTTNSNGAGAAKNINTVGASATSFTKKGLKSGVTYYVQVREIRRVGGINYIGNISCPVGIKVK